MLYFNKYSHIFGTFFFTLIIVIAVFFLSINGYIKSFESADNLTLTSIDESIELYKNNHTLTTKLPTSVNTNQIYTVTFKVPKLKLSHLFMSLSIYYAEVNAYMDNEIFYSYKIPEHTPIKSGAYTSKIIELPSNASGKTIVLEFIPQLKNNHPRQIDMIYIGKESSIILKYFFKDFIFLLVCTSLLLLFVLMLIIYLFNVDLFEKENYHYLKIMSLIALIGMYYLPQFWFFSYLTQNAIYLAYFFEFTGIFLLPAVFVQLVMPYLDPKFNPLFILTLRMAYINFFIQNMLLISGITEYKTLLPISQFIIYWTISVIFFSILRTKQSEYPKRKILIKILSPVLISVTLSLTYYLLLDELLHREFIFLVFIFFIASQTADASRQFIRIREESIKNRIFKNIAYTDGLTSINNRTAYNEFIDHPDTHKKDGYVILMDLNNLKLINDSLGHHAGDEMIKIFAEQLALLSNSTTGAQCFRIGGDEFFVHIESSIDFNVDLWLNTLKKNLQTIKAVNFDETISFSAGSEYFNPLNQSLDKAIQAADSRMYQDKLQIKTMSNNNI